MVAIAATVLAVAALAAAHPAPAPAAAPQPEIGSALPGKWYQERDHPVYALFKRDGPARVRRDGSSTATATASSSSSFPSVGSPAWSAAYPQDTPDISQLPASWTAALNAAISAGEIPDIPVSTMSSDGSPAYPGDVNANRNNATVCAATDRECRIPDNIWDAPDGIMGIGFDDGPTLASPTLYDFLKQNKQQSTHYMIGLNILNNPTIFQQAYDDLGSDIAVHTWTHPYMTTLNTSLVFAELAWTMQIIYDSTGGKLPRYWRPPYGDIDTRVSSIASNVLGLTAVLWNQDTEDWSIGSQGGTTLPAVETNMQKWLSGPKSPGLIILEHELTNDTVSAFMTAWPLVAQNGWNAVSQAEMNSTLGPYQDGKEADTPFNSLIATSTSTTSSATSASGSASASGSSPSSSGGAAAKASHSGTERQAMFGSHFVVAACVLMGTLLLL